MKITGTIFFLSIMLVFSSLSWAEDKVFTNEDLQKYQDKRKPSTTAKPGETITYEELMRRDGKLQSTPKSEEKPKPVLSENEEVAVNISGCQTLQEALDGKAGNTNAVITVLRHGRTIEEICDTVGRGCKSCSEAAKQMGSK
jgi:hypothetical protein